MVLKYDTKKSLRQNLDLIFANLNTQRNDMQTGKVEAIRNETEQNILEAEANMVEAVIDEYDALVGEEEE